MYYAVTISTSVLVDTANVAVFQRTFAYGVSTTYMYRELKVGNNSREN